jgi:DNA-binding transcriptional ArsR family regulator
MMSVAGSSRGIFAVGGFFMLHLLSHPVERLGVRGNKICYTINTLSAQNYHKIFTHIHAHNIVVFSMYNLVSFVSRGSARRKVLKGLFRANTPTELARALDIERSAVSRTIQALMKVGLVECLTPGENMNRYYRTTETGKKVLDILEGKTE